MISFVWSADYPFLAGAGGSENYTAGQIRELQRRGVNCRILTLGFGKDDGRDNFPDISFKALHDKEELSELDDTIVFITYPLNVKTKRQSYVILHCPPPINGTHDPLVIDPKGINGKRIIAPSKYAAHAWGKYFSRTTVGMHVAHPFAERDFGMVERPKRDDDTTRFLFAGRLTPSKGIYTLLASLHMNSLKNQRYEFTVTTSGGHTDDGELLLPLLKAHPRINVIPARATAEEMSQLMAEHDVIVMPTTNLFWKETFGIVSVEAQHAGCRVLASKTAGIPETDCGGLLLTKPDDPAALAEGMNKAAGLGPLSAIERAYAKRHFTVEQSVDALLKAITPARHKTSLLREPATRLSHLYPQMPLFEPRWKS